MGLVRAVQVQQALGMAWGSAFRAWKLDHNLPEGPCAFETGPEMVTVPKGSLEASNRGQRGDSEEVTEKSKGQWRCLQGQSCLMSFSGWWTVSLAPAS